MAAAISNKEKEFNSHVKVESLGVRDHVAAIVAEKTLSNRPQNILTAQDLAICNFDSINESFKNKIDSVKG